MVTEMPTLLQPCTAVTATEMHCLVPRLGIKRGSALFVKFGFLMDKVTALQKISTTQPDIGRMRLLPNPVAYDFQEDGRVQEYNAEGLVILGSSFIELYDPCHHVSSCVIMCHHVSSCVITCHLCHHMSFTLFASFVLSCHIAMIL